MVKVENVCGGRHGSEKKVGMCSVLKERTCSPLMTRMCVPLKARTCSSMKTRTCSPLKARTCSPLKVRVLVPKARAGSPLKVRTCSPLKAIGTSTQGSTLMRKQEIDSLRGPVIPNSKDWTLDVGNLCG